MVSQEILSEVSKGSMLPLMEAFYTIQGEGTHTGTAAYFIRIGGCDVGCHWCDVKESWNATLHPPTPVDTIVANVVNNADTVVVTGGEPLTWDLSLLTKKLKDNHLKTHIETSGVYDLSGTWDWICLSPKKYKLPKQSIYNQAHELKVIIHNKHDFIFAEAQAQLIHTNALLFLQPEWSKREEITPLIIDYVMRHPKWRISLQTHKYLNIP